MDNEEFKKLVPLPFWLELAQEAGVPFIPAISSPRFPLEWGSPLIGVAYQWIQANLCKFDRPMVRWESCTGDTFKYHACKADPYGEWATQIGMDDCRGGETAPFGATVLDADWTTCWMVRPWIDPVRVNGYPVEFRVFAGPGGLITGVSSYYPQRPISDPTGLQQGVGLELAIDAYRLAKKMLDARWEWSIGCTLDFLVPFGGEMTFLEGGPPHVKDHMMSASPCCFLPGEIEGIALVNRNPVEPEPEIDYAAMVVHP